jgi:1,4-alpha-glucan branching enzyme
MSNAAITSGERTGPVGRYSARRPLHSVTFYCDAPQARHVALIGDFNQWNPTAHPMTRTPDGRWVIRLDLPHGHYRYLFLVDGKPQLDPRAHGTVRESNEWHDALSLIEVS